MADGITHCTECRHFDRHGTEGLCRRHPPAASDRPFEVARWPETRAVDACGEGEPAASDHAVERLSCRHCLFWNRPGVGIDPSQRGDHQKTWWQEAGHCRRNAPRPGVEIGNHAFWRVTHASARCADGRRT